MLYISDVYKHQRNRRTIPILKIQRNGLAICETRARIFQAYIEVREKSATRRFANLTMLYLDFSKREAIFPTNSLIRASSLPSAIIRTKGSVPEVLIRIRP